MVPRWTFFLVSAAAWASLVFSSAVGAGAAAPRREEAGIDAQITEAEQMKAAISADPGAYDDVSETLRVIDETLAALAARKAALAAPKPRASSPTVVAALSDASASAGKDDPREADITTIASRVHANGASESAVAETRDILRRVLRDADATVVRKLAAAPAHIHLFPAGSKLTDLPQMSAMKGASVGDGRLYDDLPGVANVKQDDGSFATFLGEDYLGLGKLPSHPRGFLVTHEFAHVIDRFAISTADKDAVKAQFEKAKKAGGLKGFDPYHLNSAYEYFAQVFSAYRGVGYVATETKAALKSAAPATYDLVGRLFTPEPKVKK